MSVVADTPLFLSTQHHDERSARGAPDGWASVGNNACSVVFDWVSVLRLASYGAAVVHREVMIHL